MRDGNHRGITGGTIAVLVLTVLILALYAVVVPSLTGHESITADFGNFVIAVDSTITRTVGTKTPVMEQKALVTAMSTKPVPTTAVTPMPTKAPNRRITVSLGGSISLNQEALKAMTYQGQVNLQPVFEDLAGAMKTDLSIVTLENTIITNQKATNQNMPSDLLTAIAQTGVNTVCMGYSGVLNNGVSGLAATKQAIRQAGLMPFGAYETQQERISQIFTRGNGIKIALLHFQDVLDSAGKKKTSKEERETALVPINLDIMQSEIAAARRGGAQLVVVSLCWGKTGADKPTAEQRKMAQQLADAGADLIIGTHTQTVQTVDILQANRADGSTPSVLCAYSLGNLCTANREKRYALAGMILYATLEIDAQTGDASLLNASYLPTYSWRGKDEGRTRYRTLRNDGSTFNSYVDNNQQRVMKACYEMVENVMQETGIPPAYQ